SDYNQTNSLKISAANIYQENRNYTAILKQIEETDPDIIFLLETDDKWAKAMKVLSSKYPENLSEPLNNTYGLLFYSRFKMSTGKINYLVKNDVPSIDLTITLLS